MPLATATPPLPERPAWRELWRSLVLTAVVIAAVTTALAVSLYNRELELHRQTIDAVAELRAQQLGTWVLERLQSASLHATSFPQAEMYQQWREERDPEARDRLFLRLSQFATAGGFTSVMLLDETGELLWHEDAAPELLTREHRDELLTAAARLPSAYIGPYYDTRGELQLDFVTRLPVAPPAPQPVVVLHVRCGDFLGDDLLRFPVPVEGSQVQLFRRAGAEVMLLSRLDPDGVGGPALTVLPVAQTLLAELPASLDPARPARVTGPDLRGVEVHGAAADVPGTDWLLVATVDARESLRAALPLVFWTAALGILLYFAIAAVLVMRRQQQQLARSVAAQQEQAGQLRAMQLLGAIADSSTDCIYVKDLEGRYLLFNRASTEFTGRTAEEVLGKDDRFLFPPSQAEMLLATHEHVLEAGRTVTVEETVDSVNGTRFVLATKGPLYDDDGTLIGVYGIARDVTEQQLSAIRLQRQREELARQNKELVRFNRVMVGRELEMRRLKEEVNELARQLGREPPYKLHE